VVAPAGTTLSGPLTATSDATGRVSFPDLALVGPLGSSTLRFSATIGGVEIAVETPVTLFEASLTLTLDARTGSGPFGPLPAVRPGDAVEFRLTFGNAGNDAATGVNLALQLPSGFILSAALGGAATLLCPQATPSVVANALTPGPNGLSLALPNACPSLAPGASGTLTFVVEVQ
jgi:uncharacterized repeat protein (TIGR01451 family)